MAADLDPVEFVDYRPDERMYEADLAALPPSLGRPVELPASRARARVVGLGATLTGLTLLLGIALVAVGIGEALSNSIVLAITAIVVGLGLAGTHWGWVHVAELTGNRLERRRQLAVGDQRRQWLAAIEPYTQWEVRTRADADGSITIETVRHRPVAVGERTFSFVEEIDATETHSGEEPAAVVTERAEFLRRQAAAETQRARELFEVARDAYERALIAADDEQQRRDALHAASAALSERINSHLRDPPLTE